MGSLFRLELVECYQGNRVGLEDCQRNNTDKTMRIACEQPRLLWVFAVRASCFRVS